MDRDALMKPPQPRTASPALARGSRTRLKSQATLILKREHMKAIRRRYHRRWSSGKEEQEGESRRKLVVGLVTTYQSFALRFNLVTHAQVSCSSDRLTRGWLLLDRQNTPRFSLGARMRAIKIVPTSTMHCNVVTCFQSEPRNSFQTCKTFSHISLLWRGGIVWIVLLHIFSIAALLSHTPWVWPQHTILGKPLTCEKSIKMLIPRKSWKHLLSHQWTNWNV